MRFPLPLLAAWLCAAACGCRTDSHRVEGELRKRETQLREVQEELDRCATYNRALQAEVRAVQGEPIGVDVSRDAGPAFPVRSLTLGRQTGGRELEGVPGDGALQVVLEPRDAEGHAIKIPRAAAVVQVTEIGPDGLKHALSLWEIPPEQLSAQWRTGLLTTGYVLVLPWKIQPATEKLRVVALLRLADGRAFEADKDITIRLPQGVKPRIMPPASPPPEPTDGPVLPLPRTVDPNTPAAADTPKGPALTARKPWWSAPTPKPLEAPATIGRPVP